MGPTPQCLARCWCPLRGYQGLLPPRQETLATGMGRPGGQDPPRQSTSGFWIQGTPPKVALGSRLLPATAMGQSGLLQLRTSWHLTRQEAATSPAVSLGSPADLPLASVQQAAGSVHSCFAWQSLPAGCFPCTSQDHPKPTSQARSKSADSRELDRLPLAAPEGPWQPQGWERLGAGGSDECRPDTPGTPSSPARQPAEDDGR